MSVVPENIHPIFDRLVSRKEREQFFNQKAKVFWLTGLSGSGKSTIGQLAERKLFNEGLFVQLIDGDNIRSGINNNLGFSMEDRKENIRRISEITKLYLNSGIICINTFVSPTIKIREYAKSIIGDGDFEEVFINTPLEICESRDVKGLYKKARAGEIKGFTGIDSPYEAPLSSNLEIKTANHTIEESTDILLRFIKNEVSI